MSYSKRPTFIKIIAVIFIALFCYTTYKSYSIRAPKVKYILLWKNTLEPLSGFLNGQEAFNKFDCTVKDCYVTTNKYYFGGNLSKFHAIMFHAEQLDSQLSMYPEQRYKHQKYVLAVLKPVRICHSFLDGFFNWTATFKLNSDVVFHYFAVKDKRSNELVGPRRNMNWVPDMKEVDEDFADTLKTKTKAAAWFAHNCDPKERNEFVKNLQAALKRHDLSLDVYGDCGPFKCPRTEQEKCNSMIKRDYYFYMALENSFHEDFVSEKVLHGLLNNAIPIVFGGANYSRFLPPLSYINAKKYTIKELAALMNNLIESPYLYRQYFRWRNHYEFISTMPEDQSGNKRMFNFTKYEGEGVCNFCAALHDKKKMETSTVYENIRSWWSPDYAEKC